LDSDQDGHDDDGNDQSDTQEGGDYDEESKDGSLPDPDYFNLNSTFRVSYKH